MLNKIVSDTLFILGMPAHIKGFAFTRDAIIHAIKEPEVINAVTKRLYPDIAEAHNTTSSRVERAIRHSVEVVWDRGNIDMLHSYFGYTVDTNKGKPTNSEFIALIAQRLITANAHLLDAEATKPSTATATATDISVPTYRMCLIKGSRCAAFHTWHTLGEKPTAIVEFDDGTIAQVLLPDIQFIDKPHTEK